MCPGVPMLVKTSEIKTQIQSAATSTETATTKGAIGGKERAIERASKNYFYFPLPKLWGWLCIFLTYITIKSGKALKRMDNTQHAPLLLEPPPSLPPHPQFLPQNAPILQP